MYFGLHVIRGIMIGGFYYFLKMDGYSINPPEAFIMMYSGIRGAIGLILALYVLNEDNLLYVLSQII